MCQRVSPCVLARLSVFKDVDLVFFLVGRLMCVYSSVCVCPRMGTWGRVWVWALWSDSTWRCADAGLVSRGQHGAIPKTLGWARSWRVKTRTLALGLVPFLRPRCPHLTNKEAERDDLSVVSSPFAILRSFMVPEVSSFCPQQKM